MSVVQMKIKNKRKLTKDFNDVIRTTKKLVDDGVGFKIMMVTGSDTEPIVESMSIVPELWDDVVKMFGYAGEFLSEHVSDAYGFVIATNYTVDGIDIEDEYKSTVAVFCRESFGDTKVFINRYRQEGDKIVWKNKDLDMLDKINWIEVDRQNFPDDVIPSYNLLDSLWRSYKLNSLKWTNTKEKK